MWFYKKKVINKILKILPIFNYFIKFKEWNIAYLTNLTSNLRKLMSERNSVIALVSLSTIFLFHLDWITPHIYKWFTKEGQVIDSLLSWESETSNHTMLLILIILLKLYQKQMSAAHFDGIS